MVPGRGLREVVGGGEVDALDIEVDELQVHLLGHSPHEVCLGHEAAQGQDPRDGVTCPLSLCEDVLHVLERHPLAFDQDPCQGWETGQALGDLIGVDDVALLLELSDDLVDQVGCEHHVSHALSLGHLGRRELVRPVDLGCSRRDCSIVGIGVGVFDGDPERRVDRLQRGSKDVLGSLFAFRNGRGRVCRVLDRHIRGGCQR